MSSFGGAGFSKTSYGPKKDSKVAVRPSKTRVSPSKIPGLTARALTTRRTSSKTVRNGSKIPGLTRNAKNPRGIPSNSDKDDDISAFSRSTEVAPLHIPLQRGLIKKEFLKLQEKKIAQTPIPERETMHDSKQSVAAQLKKLLYTVCERPEEKYLLLKKRDDLLSKARVHNFDIHAQNTVFGTLKELCPEKERYSRQMQGTESFYECDNNGFNPDRAVKEYSRSAADQELPLPHEMRPIETLELSMDFLMSEVADDNVSTGSELLRWFDFLWNRTRAIRKDITQQQLVSERVVALIEKCARFHIFSGYRLAPLSPQFDQRLNIENLNKCLLSLRHCYDDLARKNIVCPNEAEFRSYDILLNLCDSNVFNQSCQYRQEIQNDKMVQNALEIALSFHADNISRFFKLVEANETTFLQACLCYIHFQAFRVQLLMQASIAFKSENILHYLTPYFAFQNDKDCLDFLTYHGCQIKESKKERTLISLAGAKPKSELKDFPDPIVAKKLKSPISEIIYNGNPPKVVPPKATVSFDSQNRYAHDPILKEFLQQVGEDNIVIPEKKVPFTFGEPVNNKNPFGTDGFMNKNLFPPRYSEDPNEAVPVKRFLPPTTSKPFSFNNKPFESKPSTLASPSLLSVPNAFLPPKSSVTSPPATQFPTTLPSFMPPKPIEPPPGPSKEEIEAEKKRIEIEKQKAEYERRRIEEETRKKKEMEKAKLQKMVSTLSEKIFEDIVSRSVKKLVVKNAGLAQRNYKENVKSCRRALRKSTHSLFDDLLRDVLGTFAEKAYSAVRQKWMRLEVLNIELRQQRLDDRCRRYIKIWKWATKRKREIRAIAGFSKSLANRSNEAIQGISKTIKPIFGAPISRKDSEKLLEIKKQKIVKKYFNLWKNIVVVRRQKKEAIRNKFSISHNCELPQLLQLREEQKKRLLEGSNILFPNRKRPSSTEPECPVEKRVFTSTPYRPQFEQDRLVFNISPVIRTISPAASSNSDGQNQLFDVTEKLKELNDGFKNVSQLLKDTRKRNADILSRYKDIFTDVNT